MKSEVIKRPKANKDGTSICRLCFVTSDSATAETSRYDTRRLSSELTVVLPSQASHAAYSTADSKTFLLLARSQKPCLFHFQQYFFSVATIIQFVSRGCGYVRVNVQLANRVQDIYQMLHGTHVTPLSLNHVKSKKQETGKIN